jgi:hypothetical protein
MPQPTPELYLPMPVAVQAGVLDLSAVKPHEPQSAALAIANGCMPDRAGLVKLPGGQVGAFDFVTVTRKPRESLLVAPLPKQAVAERGAFAMSGHVVLVTEDTVREVAETLPWDEAQWRSGFIRAGSVGIRHLFDTPVLELRGLDAGGQLDASPPRRYF